MKIEEYLDEWEKDSVINRTELGNESTHIPKLHGKWLKYLSDERLRLRSLHIKRRKLNSKLGDYYRGDLNNQNDLDELGRKPQDRVILKNEISSYVEADDEMIELDMKVLLQQEKVDVITEIMKSINTRNFVIKNAIDFLKFCNGVV